MARTWWVESDYFDFVAGMLGFDVGFTIVQQSRGMRTIAALELLHALVSVD